MPERTEYNAYMATYMLRRYHRRRAAAVALLGSRCGMCGSTDGLEIDHRDPTTKSFDIAKGLAGFAQNRIDAELAKCWLLCASCHRKKSKVEQAVKRSRRIDWEHGTLSGYNYCRCDGCREAKRAYNAAYHAAHRG